MIGHLYALCVLFLAAGVPRSLRGLGGDEGRRPGRCCAEGSERGASEGFEHGASEDFKHGAPEGSERSASEGSERSASGSICLLG